MAASRLNPVIRIADRAIGPGHPVYVIAEISGNHNGDYGRAVELVHAAAGAGADAVKLQTYTPDTLTLDSDAPWFRVGEETLWSGRRLHDLYGEAMTPWDWQPGLKAEAEALGLACFSSPFDASAVDFLLEMDVPAFKVASFELVDLDLISRVAATGRPVILSTGMATRAEIDEALSAAVDAGAGEVALLRCNSAYPAPAAEMDLRTVAHMIETWQVPVGLSDHTLGIAAAVTAVALGATLLEKHITLRRSDGGPDSGFSLEPAEFSQMVAAVREAESALGGVRYGPSEAEAASLGFRRSLFVVVPVEAGETFTTSNVRSIRPGDGLPPRCLPLVLGRRAATRIEAGTPLTWAAVADPP